MKKIIILIISISFLSSCKEVKKEDIENKIQSEIFNDVLLNLIDSTTSPKSNNKIIIHYEIYPDKVKKFSIKNLISNLADTTAEGFSLVRKLEKVINDSIKLNNEFKAKVDFEFAFNLSEEKSLDIIEKNKEKYFGFVNLSKTVVNHKKDYGCFYYAYQCGGDCSHGYVVFVKKKNNKWFIYQLIDVWE